MAIDSIYKFGPQDVGTSSSPTFAGITLSGLTASLLVQTDGAKALASVSDLTSWIAGTTNQVTVTDDSDGTVTLSTPQNIHTGASPTFADMTLSSPSNIYSLSHDSFADFVAAEHLSLPNTVVNVLSDGDFGSKDITTTGDASVDEMTLVSQSLANYIFGSRANQTLWLQGQRSGLGTIFEFFNKDGDATDDSYISIYGRGTPTQTTNREQLQLRYYSGSRFQISTIKLGSGTARPLVIQVEGATDQIRLNTNGDVLMVGTYDDIVGEERRDLFIDTTGKLGYVSSSQRYKKNIRDLDNSSSIYNLRPVKFDRKDGSAVDEVGLIAEEVELVMPELVSYQRNVIEKVEKIDKDTEEEIKTIDRIETTRIPETVSYSQLIVPMLKELQELNIIVNTLKSDLLLAGVL